MTLPFIWLTCLLIPSLARGENDDLRKHIDRGNQLAIRGDWAKAAEEYTHAIQINPLNARTLYFRGLAYTFVNKPDQAMKDLDGSLYLDPTSARTLTARGIAYGQKKEFKRAIVDFDAALRLDPVGTVAHRYRGWARVELKMHNEAIEDFTDYLRLVPDDPESYIGLSVCYEAKGAYDSSLRDAEEAVRLGPKNPSALYQRARARIQKCDWRGSLADLDETIEIDPKYSFAYALKAWLLSACPDDKIRNGVAAVKAGRQACELTDWKSSHNLEMLASAYAECGEFAEATKLQLRVMDDIEYFKSNGIVVRDRLEKYKSKQPNRMPSK